MIPQGAGPGTETSEVGRAASRNEALIGEDVLQEIGRAAQKADPKETIGILAGYRVRDPAGNISVVRASFSDEHQSTRTTVDLSLSQRSRLLHGMKKAYPDCIEVGWWHSHPGFTAFLSPTDQDNARRNYSEWFHLSIVYDNRSDDLKVFKPTPDGYRFVRFLVVDSVDDSLLGVLRGAPA